MVKEVNHVSTFILHFFQPFFALLSVDLNYNYYHFGIFGLLATKISLPRLSTIGSVRVIYGNRVCSRVMV